MKKILVLLLILFFAPCTFAKTKNVPLPQEGGYVGALPNVTDRFQPSVPTKSAPIFDSVDGFNDQSQIKPSPKDNPAFVNIIMKKDKTARYINDLNNIIPLVEKLAVSIENQADTQKFCAQAHNIDMNVEYFREKYKNKSEASYISFKKLMQLNMQIQSVSLLRSESATYAPYLASEKEGFIYNSNSVNQQLDYLLAQINDTLVILREAK